jgi:hypothetical protein
MVARVATKSSPIVSLFLEALRWPQNLTIQTHYIPATCPRL